MLGLISPKIIVKEQLKITKKNERLKSINEERYISNYKQIVEITKQINIMKKQNNDIKLKLKEYLNVENQQKCRHCLSFNSFKELNMNFSYKYYCEICFYNLMTKNNYFAHYASCDNFEQLISKNKYEYEYKWNSIYKELFNNSKAILKMERDKYMLIRPERLDTDIYGSNINIKI